jgi:hypothetical protein
LLDEARRRDEATDWAGKHGPHHEAALKNKNSLSSSESRVNPGKDAEEALI